MGEGFEIGRLGKGVNGSRSNFDVVRVGSGVRE